jgi:hypothetical protein
VGPTRIDERPPIRTRKNESLRQHLLGARCFFALVYASCWSGLAAHAQKMQLHVCIATAGDGLRCVWLDFLGVFAFIKSQKPIKGSGFVPGAFKKAVFS